MADPVTCSNGCCTYNLHWVDTWETVYRPEVGQAVRIPVDFCPQTGERLGVDAEGNPAVTHCPSPEYVRRLEEAAVLLAARAAFGDGNKRGLHHYLRGSMVRDGTIDIDLSARIIFDEARALADAREKGAAQ